MARRTIVECDLCKQEVEDDGGLLKITIKKPKAKTGNAFEICPSCAEKVQTQLVASSDKRLNPEWAFVRPVSLRRMESMSDQIAEQEGPLDENDEQVAHVAAREQARRRREKLADADFDSESLAAPGTSQEAAEVVQEEVSFGPSGERSRAVAGGPQTVQASVGDPNCSHPNKTKPKFGQIRVAGEVQKAMYRKCLDCGKALPMQTVEQRAAYGNSRTGDADIQLRTHDKEDRKPDQGRQRKRRTPAKKATTKR